MTLFMIKNGFCYLRTPLIFVDAQFSLWRCFECLSEANTVLYKIYCSLGKLEANICGCFFFLLLSELFNSYKENMTLRVFVYTWCSKFYLGFTGQKLSYINTEHQQFIRSENYTILITISACPSLDWNAFKIVCECYFNSHRKHYLSKSIS